MTLFSSNAFTAKTQPWRHILLPLVAVVGTLFVVSAHAAPVPRAPTIAAKSYILMDTLSGRVIAETNMHEQVEPASLTKMMTVHVALSEIETGHISLTDEVVVSEKAWKTEGSRMFIEVSKKVTVEELLKGIIIQSGNDASVALAEYVAGSEDAFADLMNIHADKLGMTDSFFVNSTGLPAEGHLTSAHDMALLAIATINDYPDYYRWYAEKDYTYNSIKQHNRNRLLWWDETVDGLKTGHTESAGYCLVASAVRDEMRLVSAVLGTSGDKERATETQKLLNYGFRFFKTHTLYTTGQSLNQAPLLKGSRPKVSLGIAEDIAVTVPRNDFANISPVLNIDQHIVAPVQKGQVLGELVVSLNDETLATAPLVALEDVPEGSFFSKMIDQVKIWLQ